MGLPKLKITETKEPEGSYYWWNDTITIAGGGLFKMLESLIHEFGHYLIQQLENFAWRRGQYIMLHERWEDLWFILKFGQRYPWRGHLRELREAEKHAREE